MVDGSDSLQDIVLEQNLAIGSQGFDAVEFDINAVNVAIADGLEFFDRYLFDVRFVAFAHSNIRFCFLSFGKVWQFATVLFV